jgi:hypothetical protein
MKYKSTSLGKEIDKGATTCACVKSDTPLAAQYHPNMIVYDTD